MSKRYESTRYGMKGIILAGGMGSRLFPVTKEVNKQLLPVYDKPMIYYPLSILMLANIRDILIISCPEHLPRFKSLFDDGRQLGLNISYADQIRPEGLAQAFLLGKEFIESESVCLILGDNIFYGHGFYPILNQCRQLEEGCIILGYYVNDPENYGVVELDDHQNVVSIEEKPENPKSNYAIPGLYFFDNKVIQIASRIKPSRRGELEITDVIKEYFNMGTLKVELIGRGYAWLDTGTHENLLEAGTFIETLEKRQGLKIGCIEEVAFRMGFIDKIQLEELSRQYQNSNYGTYLKKLVSQHGNIR